MSVARRQARSEPEMDGTAVETLHAQDEEALEVGIAALQNRQSQSQNSSKSQVYRHLPGARGWERHRVIEGISGFHSPAFIRRIRLTDDGRKRCGS